MAWKNKYKLFWDQSAGGIRVMLCSNQKKEEYNKVLSEKRNPIIVSPLGYLVAQQQKHFVVKADACRCQVTADVLLPLTPWNQARRIAADLCRSSGTQRVLSFSPPQKGAGRTPPLVHRLLLSRQCCIQGETARPLPPRGRLSINHYLGVILYRACGGTLPSCYLCMVRRVPSDLCISEEASTQRRNIGGSGVG